MNKVLGLLFAVSVISPWAYSQPVCERSPLSEEQVKSAVARERISHAELPAEFPDYSWKVLPRGCHYTYIEYGLPEAPGYVQRFLVNRNEIVVDASPGKLICSDRVIESSELAAIISRNFKQIGSLQVSLAGYTTRVVRKGCLYILFQYQNPETKDRYIAYTIDQLGELIDYAKSDKY